MKKYAFGAALAVALISGFSAATRGIVRPVADVKASGSYRCPMHPQYVTQKPGECPVCGMKLELADGVDPATRRNEGNPLDTHVAEAKLVRFVNSVHAAGHVVFDPPTRFSAATSGTVQDIYKITGNLGGVRVRAGERILLFTPAKQGGEPSLLRASVPMVLASTAQPGQIVGKGADLYDYTDLSTLSILVDVKSGDIPAIRPGLSVTATIPSRPGKTWHGRLAQSQPLFDERTQTLRARAEFPNDDPEIWQGMLARVDMSCGVRNVLAIPATAVTSADGEPSVFVMTSTGEYSARRVHTGARSDDLIEVIEGLRPGERVATTGLFLLDSDARLRGAVSPVR